MKIRNAFFDIDGVLTDGAVYIHENGTESKRIIFDDIDAIFELKRTGVRIGFITGESNYFTEYVKNRFKPDFFLSGCKDKLRAFKLLSAQEDLDVEGTCFVGDSSKDLELIKFLKNYSFVPSDGDENLKKSARFVVSATRGNGVIKEVTNIICQMNNE